MSRPLCLQHHPATQEGSPGSPRTPRAGHLCCNPPEWACVPRIGCVDALGPGGSKARGTPQEALTSPGRLARWAGTSRSQLIPEDTVRRISSMQGTARQAPQQGLLGEGLPGQHREGTLSLGLKGNGLRGPGRGHSGTHVLTGRRSPVRGPLPLLKLQGSGLADPPWAPWSQVTEPCNPKLWHSNSHSTRPAETEGSGERHGPHPPQRPLTRSGDQHLRSTAPSRRSP